jgi:hypothetical protein
LFLSRFEANLGDKISILELKAERIGDLARFSHVLTELASLNEARQRSIFDHEGGGGPDRRVECDQRCPLADRGRDPGAEKAADFGPRFVELARSVYQTNDRRAAVKRRINERLGSAILEEKSYATNGPTAPYVSPAG